MRLSQCSPDTLKATVENARAAQHEAFQLVIAPIFPQLFPKVAWAAEQLYECLAADGYRVLLDDRNQKPKNMFLVIDFLQIPHRFVISGRSLDAGVVEYSHRPTEQAQKIPLDDLPAFIAALITIDT
ncbi:MAG TPA: hypothetical protein ENK78_02425 [Thiothrix sp.]|nr:hypothetical protein [Thiothrix sp.]